MNLFRILKSGRVGGSGMMRVAVMAAVLFCLSAAQAFAWWEIGFDKGKDDFGDPVLERKFYESSDEYGAVWFYLDDKDNIEDCNIAFECEAFEEEPTSGLCVVSVKDEDGKIFSWKTRYWMNSDGFWQLKLGLSDSIGLFDVFASNEVVRLIVKDLDSGIVFDYGLIDCSDFLDFIYEHEDEDWISGADSLT